MGITKREEWQKDLKFRRSKQKTPLLKLTDSNNITKLNQLDSTRTVYSLDSEEERPLKTRAKLSSTSKTALIRLVPDSTLEEESLCLQRQEHRQRHQIQSSLGYRCQHSRTHGSRQSPLQEKLATKSHGCQS